MGATNRWVISYPLIGQALPIDGSRRIGVAHIYVWCDFLIVDELRWTNMIGGLLPSWEESVPEKHDFGTRRGLYWSIAPKLYEILQKILCCIINKDFIFYEIFYFIELW